MGPPRLVWPPNRTKNAPKSQRTAAIGGISRLLILTLGTERQGKDRTKALKAAEPPPWFAFVCPVLQLRAKSPVRNKSGELFRVTVSQVSAFSLGSKKRASKLKPSRPPVCRPFCRLVATRRRHVRARSTMRNQSGERVWTLRKFGQGVQTYPVNFRHEVARIG